jgi:hypothetical protein
MAFNNQNVSKVLNRFCASAFSLSLIAIGCSSPSAPSPTVAATSPSPSNSPTEIPIVRPEEFAECAGLAESVEIAARNCLNDYQSEVVTSTQLVYHFGPGLSEKAQTKYKEYGAWALPYLSGFLSVLKKPATIHIFVVTDSKWCGDQLEPFYYGTAKELSEGYLCQVGTGANAGHTKLPRTAFVSHRPLNVSTSEEIEIMVAEMGHASRSLMMEEYTGELGGQPYWPIWSQYLVNEILWKLALQREGLSESSARAEGVWKGCEQKLTWRPDYGDSRIQSWDIPDSGLYGCPPSDSPNVETPNHYNMAYMAAEYFTATRGFDWIQDVFMPTLVMLRGDKEAAAKEFGWESWRSMEEELNENMYQVIKSYGVSVPKP